MVTTELRDVFTSHSGSCKYLETWLALMTPFIAPHNYQTRDHSGLSLFMSNSNHQLPSILCPGHDTETMIFSLSNPVSLEKMNGGYSKAESGSSN